MWFAEVQQALKGEVERVSRALDRQSKSDANYWKAHLRWELLERNLGPLETINIEELQLVRRWLFSNRKGLEWTFFAPLRTLINQYIDAVFTAQHNDLQNTFIEKIELTREQCIALVNMPTDARAAALGRTLAWFDQTRQLGAEVAAVRDHLSGPNAQIVVSDPLIASVLATEVREVTETVSVSDTVDVPGGRFIPRSRSMVVRGTATSQGIVSVTTTPNEQVAELALGFDGTVDSTAIGRTGPVTIRMAISGSARATKPIYLSPRGIELGETIVVPKVKSRVTGVSAGADLIEFIARRRAEQPESQTLMNRRANSATVEQLKTKLDQRVAEALAKMESEASRVQSSLGEFHELTAPLEREGATPRLEGLQSTRSSIQLNARAEQRGQFGAAAPCPHYATIGDVQLRLHVSAFNNMVETITGGKTLDDKFLMKYAKVLHAELPLPLMVHARSKRWAFFMRRHRPIELVIPQLNHFDFIVRIEGLEVDGRSITEPAVATIRYELRVDDLGEYALHRLGDVELETELSADIRALVYEKINAFFGPILNGGGVVVPEGGVLAPLRRLQSRGIRAEHEWITIAFDVPPEAIDEFRRFRGQPAHQR